jgi:predicted ATPase/DNA-binding CsgD family transcriptional regulator
VEEVASLLADYRPVTLTGPGGVGKTRLAGQVAQAVAGRFADGVWLVELAALQESAPVAAVVANALGVQQVPGVAVAECLAGLLARRQLLLVLDNCEHVLTSVADLCGRLLPLADDLRLLATSREQLGITGEVRYRLQSLGLPPPGNPDAVFGSEAVTLFAERARRVDHRFRLTAQTAPAAARVVRRLDGMPLAIELAAARVAALGVTQLAERLDDPAGMQAGDDRLGILAGGDRLAAARHRSLAATAQWSYDLLPEPERNVFRKLAVFRSPFTLEAAEAVAGPGAAHVVLHLVDCSLLAPPQTGADGRVRYLMLETLRAYGAQLLARAVAEHDGAAAALTAFAVDVAGRAAARLASGAGELDAARWLDAEDGTVHQGLDWALEHDQGSALALATSLAPWWELRGRFAAGYALVSRAVDGATAGSPQWCEAQLCLGSLARYSSSDAALGHFTAVRDVLAGKRASPLLVRALNERAGCLVRLGQVAEAAKEAGRALAMARDLNLPAGEARALYWLGATAAHAGDVAAGVSWSRQTQRIDQAALPGSLARRCVVGLTMALMEAGELAEARQACTRGLSLARQAGDVLDISTCLLVLTDLDLRADRLLQARTHLHEALELGSQIGVPVLLADCLDWCGHLCAREQRWADALVAWAARAALQQLGGKTDEPLPDALRREDPQRKARQALGPQQSGEAEQRGAVMSTATATEFALLLTAATPRIEPADLSMPQLSGRERELVTLVAQGRTDAQIAEQLYISIRTVRSHLDRIRDKTGCRRRADLTRLALQAQLV